MVKQFPVALVNITNRCNLRCSHCFVFREGNPNIPTTENEMPAIQMVKEIQHFKELYGIRRMLWMGGEPLLRKDVLRLGVKLFSDNVIATNGTVPLINLGPKIKWTVSLDGPEIPNDEIRGKGSFKKVINNLNNLPEDFKGDLQCNCVVTRKNENNFEEIIDILKYETPIRGITFSYYVPKRNDKTDLGWKTLEERDRVIEKTKNLKKENPTFILNNLEELNLLSSKKALNVTRNCILKKISLPLYLGKNGFEIPYCCYGNDVDCDMCGAWGVFHVSALSGMN